MTQAVDERRELLRRFAQVEGSGLTEAALDVSWVGIPLARIAADPESTEKIISALQWIADRVRAAS